MDPDGFWFSIPEELVLKAYPYEDFELLASGRRVLPNPRHTVRPLAGDSGFEFTSNTVREALEDEFS